MQFPFILSCAKCVLFKNSAGLLRSAQLWQQSWNTVPGYIPCAHQCLSTAQSDPEEECDPCILEPLLAQH